MDLMRKLLFGGLAFSWIMVFLSWGFAYSLEIIADWALLAIVLSAVYGVMLYRYRIKRSFEDPASFK